jgi:SIR2-like domain
MDNNKIDPIISLGISMQSNKGVYALLLGSGVSRSAEIPTGWDVTLDLIKKLAKLTGEDCGEKPDLWYKEKFGKEPDYSEILGIVGKSKNERQSLLKNYFEQNDEEREEGKKLPTKAHKAIASLVKNGYIKVIITTNFDRLIEKALEEIGINPVVIYTPGAINNAPPIVHNNCTIIKVHGDYLDTRIKNTTDELSEYSRPLKLLLKRVLDEFGLIVCGWSAEWDTALCDVIKRCATYKYTTFWAYRSAVNEKAKDLINFRKAVQIKIEDADTFFHKLSEDILSLENISPSHSLSKKVVIAKLKKYLKRIEYEIDLHDLVINETKNLYNQMSDEKFPVQGINRTQDEFVNRMKKYESISDILISMIINGCYWGSENNKIIWINSVQRIADPTGERNGDILWQGMRLYPALLLFYAGGIASLLKQNYTVFNSILFDVKIRKHIHDTNPIQAINELNVNKVFPDLPKSLFGQRRHHTPFNDHIFGILREPFREYIPDDFKYEKEFDRFEYLLTLIYCDLNIQSDNYFFLFEGLFWWKVRNSRYNIIEEIDREIEKLREDWLFLKKGFFNGEIERLDKAIEEFKNRFSRINL